MTTHTLHINHGSHRRMTVVGAIAALCLAATLHGLPTGASAPAVPAPGPQSTTELVSSFR